MTLQYMGIGEGLPQEEVLPQGESLSCLQPAVEVVVEHDHVVAVGQQVVDGQPKLEAATASTTKTSPNADCGKLADEAPADLLQGELVQHGEEQPQAVEERHCQDHEGDQVDEGNGH